MSHGSIVVWALIAAGALAIAVGALLGSRRYYGLAQALCAVGSALCFIAAGVSLAELLTIWSTVQ